MLELERTKRPCKRGYEVIFNGYEHDEKSEYLRQLARLTLSTSLPPKNCSTDQFEQNVETCLDGFMEYINENNDMERVKDDLLLNIQWKSLFQAHLIKNKERSALDVVLAKLFQISNKDSFFTESFLLLLFQVSSLIPDNRKKHIINAFYNLILSSSSLQHSETISSFVLRNFLKKNDLYSGQELYMIQNAIRLTLHLLTQNDWKSDRAYARKFGSELGIKMIQNLATILVSQFSKFKHVNYPYHQDLPVLKHMMELLQIVTIRSSCESRDGIAFQFILQLLRSNPKCVLLRLAAIISCLHIRVYHLQKKKNYLHILLQELYQDYFDYWTNVDKKQEQIDIMRLYVEMVIECSLFDHVYDCWMAFTPLLQHIIKYRYHKDEIALQGIGYILVHRGKVLYQNVDKYKQMIDLLKKYYTKESRIWMWGYQNQAKGTKSMEKVLIKMDILTSDTLLSERIHTDIWPFPPVISMRMVCLKMDLFQSPLFKGIFSNRLLQNVENEYLIQHKYRTKKRKQIEALEKVTYCKLERHILPNCDILKTKRIRKRQSRTIKIHKNILQVQNKEECKIQSFLCKSPIKAHVMGHIFSFLNYKRLVKAMKVCKLWYFVGITRQDLWKKLYFYRWPKSKIPKSIAQKEIQSVHSKWYFWFRQKILIERKQRYFIIENGRKNSWMVQVCQYVGCTKLHLNQISLQTHKKYHEP